MENPIVKATAIMDAKIQFVSLVDKAANKRKFLITKADGRNANFQTYGCILKSEAETHYITGIVYEPMVEDTDKNYMTAAEIAKAEKYFTENSGSIDIQHSFETEENVSVVESWITKCDCSINGKEVKKGTWLMTVKVEDDDIWDKVEKGEITGFSMGGVGKYSDEDVDLSDITDDETSVEKAEKKSLFVKLANAFGYDCIKKGEVKLILSVLSIIASYSVKFMIDDTTQYGETQIVEEGSNAILPTVNPSKESTPSTTYEFAGWEDGYQKYRHHRHTPSQKFRRGCKGVLFKGQPLPLGERKTCLQVAFLLAKLTKVLLRYSWQE